VRELARVLRSAGVLSAGAPITARAVERALGEWPVHEVRERICVYGDLDGEIRRAARMSPRQRAIARRRLGLPKSTFYRRLRRMRAEEELAT